MTRKQKVKLYLLFPLLFLMARAPGTKDQCMITLIAMVGSVAIWAAIVTTTVRVLV